MDPPSSLGYVALSMGPVYFYTNNDTGYTTISGPVGTRIVLYDLDPNATQSDVTYVRGLNLIASVKDGQAIYYHYNAHGDVVQFTDSTGAVVSSSDRELASPYIGRRLSPAVMAAVEKTKELGK